MLKNCGAGVTEPPGAAEGDDGGHAQRFSRILPWKTENVSKLG